MKILSLECFAYLFVLGSRERAKALYLYALCGREVVLEGSVSSVKNVTASSVVNLPSTQAS